MTQNPYDDPQTRPNVGPGATTERSTVVPPDQPDPTQPDPTQPEPSPLEPDDPDINPPVDPDGWPEPLPPHDPLPEGSAPSPAPGSQRENAETSLDQPSEGSD